MNATWIRSAFLFALLSALLGGCATHQTVAERQSNADKLLEASVRVIDEAMQMPESSIPERMLTKAQAIVIIPDAVEASLIVGGGHGKGVILMRKPDRTWSRPNFITLSSGSVGFQVGVQASDTVLLFRELGDAQDVFNGNFTLGADATVAAGPVGRDLKASTDVSFESQIYAWSRTKGLFAGISVDGAVLRVSSSTNEAAYGVNRNPYQIVDGQVQRTPEGALVLMNRLEEYVAAARR